MDQATKKQLAAQACKVRMGAVEAVYNAKSGHPGGSLSIADTMTYLYFKEMNIDPKDPKKADRDRLVLSRATPPRRCTPRCLSAGTSPTKSC